MVVLLHTLVNIYNRNSCKFPQFLNYIVVVYALSLIMLFSNFFYQAYIKNRASKDSIDTSKLSQLSQNGTHVAANGDIRQRFSSS